MPEIGRSFAQATSHKIVKQTTGASQIPVPATSLSDRKRIVGNCLGAFRRLQI